MTNIVNQNFIDQETEKINTAVTIPSDTTKSKRGRAANGVLSIVNTEKNGKRVVLSNEVDEHFDKPNSLLTDFTENGLALGQDLSGNGEMYAIKRQGNKAVIYSATLVEELTTRFALDFSGRTCITFENAEECWLDDEKTYLEITIKK